MSGIIIEGGEHGVSSKWHKMYVWCKQQLSPTDTDAFCHVLMNERQRKAGQRSRGSTTWRISFISVFFLNYETPLLIYLPSARCIHYSVNLCIKEWPGKLSQISCRRQRHISHICSGFKNKNLCATFAVATAVAGSHRKRAAKKMTSKYEIKLAFVSVLLKTFKLNMCKMPKSMRVK